MLHAPDEYLAAAKNQDDFKQRQQDILDTNKALLELRDAGIVESVGVGFKDVRFIDFISDHIQLDWAMFECSITPFTHEPSTLNLLKN
nr:aldo/keto reductase [Pseudoalteromonas sp. C2R02]